MGQPITGAHKVNTLRSYYKIQWMADDLLKYKWYTERHTSLFYMHRILKGV